MSDMQEIATELVFSTFVFLCAEDKAVPIAAGKRLGELMGKPGWAQSALMRRALPALRRAYIDYWKAYQGGREVAAVTVEAAWLMVSEATAPQEAASFGRDLAMLAGAIGDPQKKNGAARRGEFLAIEQVVASAQAGRGRQTSKPVAALTTDGVDVGWWSEGEIRLQCVAIDDEAPDVKTFLFRSLCGRRFRYDPGQAIQLHAEIGSKLVNRVYTISSSPSRPDRLAVTVKRIEGGTFSNWLHEHMLVGQELEASGPRGKLTCAHIDPARLLLVSAGSGVTPMMSMLRYLHDVRTPTNVVFLNNVRTPNDVIFKSELTALSATMGGSLTLAIVPARRTSGAAWNGPVGRFDEALLRAIAPDSIKREVFCCGPDGYREQVRQALLAVGHLPSRYHEERFGAPRQTAATEKAAPQAMPPTRATEKAHTVKGHTPQLGTTPQAVIPATTPVPQAPAAASRKSFTRCQVSFEKSAAVIPCRLGDLLLDVAEHNNIELDSACRVGACGTCRVQTSSEGIVMDDAGALSDHEIAQGYVLACTARVIGRAVVHC